MLYKMNMDKDKNKNKKDNVKPDALDGVLKTLMQLGRRARE